MEPASHDVKASPRRPHLVEIPRFDEATTKRLRMQLLHKRAQIAALLAEVLAGEDRDGQLRALALDAKPGERPEEGLLRGLDLVESRRTLLDERYGRCDACGADLGMPARDRCPGPNNAPNMLQPWARDNRRVQSGRPVER